MEEIKKLITWWSKHGDCRHWRGKQWRGRTTQRLSKEKECGRKWEGRHCRYCHYCNCRNSGWRHKLDTCKTTCSDWSVLEMAMPLLLSQLSLLPSPLSSPPIRTLSLLFSASLFPLPLHPLLSSCKFLIYLLLPLCYSN